MVVQLERMLKGFAVVDLCVRLQHDQVYQVQEGAHHGRQCQ